MLTAIKELSQDQLESYLKHGKLTVAGHELAGEDLKVSYAMGSDSIEKYTAHMDADLVIFLDSQYLRKRE